jgi:hypothetical protein
MFVWRDLDTKTASKRLRIMVMPFVVPFLTAVIFVAYQISPGQSFNFFTGYGVFTYSSLGLRYFGELVFPMINSITVFVALLFISSLIPIIIVAPFTDFFIRPFKDVTGFESFEKVCEAIKSFIAQGSKREKLLVAVLTLTSILALLFLSLVFLNWLGIIAINLSSSWFLLLLFVSNYSVALYSGFRIERVLKKYAETAQT